jgi:hypothetical protein
MTDPSKTHVDFASLERILVALRDSLTKAEKKRNERIDTLEQRLATLETRKDLGESPRLRGVSRHAEHLPRLEDRLKRLETKGQ